SKKYPTGYNVPFWERRKVCCRMTSIRFLSAVFILGFTGILAAQQPQVKVDVVQAAHEEESLADATPVVTHHQITVNGKLLKYTPTAGRLLIKPENNPPEAAMFFAAYTLDTEDTRSRPLTFVFNGGPGTATAWLHMGALGPRKIKLEP